MEFSELMNLLAALGWIPSTIGLFFIWKQLSVSSKQTEIMNKQNELQKNNIRREKALEMAEYFQNLITDELNYVGKVMKLNNMANIFSELEYSEFIHFDMEEMRRLLHKNKEELTNIYKDIANNFLALSDAYLDTYDNEPQEVKKILFYRNIEWEKDKIIIEKEDGKNDKAAEGEMIFEMLLMKRKLKGLYIEKKSLLLNKLEYFSMNFICNLADDEVVYQSLHQAFLSTVKELYGYIVIQNDRDGKDKYYTNIISLYKKWAEKDKKLAEKNLDINRTNQIMPMYKD